MDASLYVPWNSSLEAMQQELDTINLIKKKNMERLCELRQIIKNRELFDIKSPFESGFWKENTRKYIDLESNSFKLFEQNNKEYNSLIKQEHRLTDEIVKIGRNLEDSDVKLKELLEKKEALKKKYNIEKTSLKYVKKLFDQSFGMDIEIENIDNDLFCAIVSFDPVDKKYAIRVTISRKTNSIIDFDASSFISKEKLEELKVLFKQVNSFLPIISILKNLALNIE